MQPDVHTVTADSLRATLTPAEGRPRREANGFLQVRNVTKHNLHKLSARFPKKVLCCVTGVAGSGKSTLTFQGLAVQHPDVVRASLPVYRARLCARLTSVRWRRRSQSHKVA